MANTTRFGRKVLSMLGLCVVSAVLTGCGDKISDADIEFIGLSETRALVQDKPGTARLVDPRSADEFAEAHIPGAVNIPMVKVPDAKDSLDPSLASYKHLIVYGNDPGSAVARAVAKRFMRSGAKSVKLFSGGLAEWTRAGLKVDGTGKKAEANTGGMPVPPEAGSVPPPPPPAPR